MGVRSRRVAGPVVVAVASAWQTIYTVPVGRTLVIKSIQVTSFSVTTSFFMGVGPGGAAFGLTYGSSIAAGVGIALGNGWVLNPGDTLGCYALAANALNVYVAGSLLLGVPE